MKNTEDDQSDENTYDQAQIKPQTQMIRKTEPKKEIKTTVHQIYVKKGTQEESKVRINNEGSKLSVTTQNELTIPQEGPIQRQSSYCKVVENQKAQELK